MTDQRLLRLQRIFREILDNPNLNLSPEFSMKEHTEWDSVATVQIVLATEEEFGVRLSTDVVAAVKSVADLLRALPSP